MEKSYNLVDIEIKPKTKANKKPKNSDLFSDSCFILLCGKPGDGKSTLTGTLFSHPKLLAKKFDYILFILPGEVPGFERDPRFFIDSFDKDWVWGKLKMISMKAVEMGYIAHVCLACDDIITELERMGKDKDIEDLIYRRRWLFPNVVVSWLITTQYFNLVPRRFRVCYTHVIVFNLPPEELAQIAKAYAFVKDNETKFKVMRAHLKGPHNFIMFHIDDAEIFLNFGKRLNDVAI